MYQWLFLVQALLLSIYVEGFPVEERAKVLTFDTIRERNPDAVRLRRRDSSGTLEVDVANGLEAAVNPYAQYYIELAVGTPAQTVKVQLDTGSNDLVLNTPGSAYCVENAGLCAGATFDPETSSTYHLISKNASLGYGGGDTSSGYYVTDTIQFGGTTLKDVQMVLSLDTTTRDSIWGLSYGAGEQGIYYGEPRYPTVSELMVKAGAIASNAFSLFLNSQNTSTGSLIFGGVNQGKYHGSLNTIPVEENPNHTSQTSFIVTVTGVSLTLEFSSSAKPTIIPLLTNRADPYLIDSGTYNIEMPLELMQPILTALGAEYEAPSEFAMVPCSLAQNNASTLDFTFTSFSISVPLSELIFPSSFLAYSNVAPVMSDGQTPACLLGITPAGKDFILGDTFMRSAYIVFDIDNNEISLAQANIGAEDTQPDKIIPIRTGTAAVPGATKVKNPVRAWPNETAIANYDVPATGTWSYYAEVTGTVTATTAPHDFGGSVAVQSETATLGTLSTAEVVVSTETGASTFLMTETASSGIVIITSTAFAAVVTETVGPTAEAATTTTSVHGKAGRMGGEDVRWIGAVMGVGVGIMALL